MNVHVKLRGIPAKIVEEAVKQGIAESKAEFIRMSIVLAGKSLMEKEFKESFVEDVKRRLKEEKPKAITVEELLSD